MAKNKFETEYKKARKNALARINYYKKQGIITEIKVTKIPKNITDKSIKALDKITKEKIQSKAKFVDVDTGLIITKKEFKAKSALVKKQRALNTENKKQERLKLSDVLEQNFLDYISSYSQQGYEIAKAWLDKEISKRGKYEVFTLIQQLPIGIESEELMYRADGFNALQSKLDEMARIMDLNKEEREVLSPNYDTEGTDIYDSEGEYY